jgi:hypothetical protein
MYFKIFGLIFKGLGLGFYILLLDFQGLGPWLLMILA